MRNGSYTTTLCENDRNEAIQMVTKPRLTVKKVLQSIWWNWKGTIYYELHLYSQKQNLDFYCQQLERLGPSIDQKQRG